MLHKSIMPKLLPAVLSSADKFFVSLLAFAVSFNATFVACSVLLFVIKFTSSANQSLAVSELLFYAGTNNNAANIQHVF